MTLSKKISKKNKTTSLIKPEQIDPSNAHKTRRQRPEDKIFIDLENMYHAAFEAKNYAVALRILELRAKQFGLFLDKKPEPIKPLQQMSLQELQAFLTMLDK